jgi:uncharacterized membrane protein
MSGSDVAPCGGVNADNPDADPSRAARGSSTGLSPRLAAPLAYAGWWVTGAIFWFVERRDAFVRFHAAQALAAFGLIAALVSGLCLLAAASLTFLPSAFTPLVWIAGLTFVVGLALWLVAMWKAATGKAWRIPVAAGLADRLSRVWAAASA